MNYGIDMLLKHIVEDPECTAAFDRVLPGVRNALGSKTEALRLSIRDIASYTKGAIPQAALDELDDELKAIGAKNGGISPSEHARIAKYHAIWNADQEAVQVLSCHHQNAVYPGQPWLDVTGRRIQAHAGGFLYEDGTYYWYGENKEHTDGKSEIWTWGIRLYSSTDFYNWIDLGLIIPPVLDDPSSELYPEKRVDRPHILKNPRTGQYVCWIKNSGPDACFNVMTANQFTGPWTFANVHYNPFGLRVGDFDIALDETTGIAYLYCEADHRFCAGMRLNADFTAAEEIVSRQYDGIDPPFTREGVSVFQRENQLWMLTSGMTGYIPNQSDSAVSSSYENPFVPVGDPHVADDTLASFNSQIGQVFRVPGKKNLYVAVADRWMPEFPLDRERALAIRRAVGAHYNPGLTPSDQDRAIFAAASRIANVNIADYVILPIAFEHGKPQIEWRDKWRLEDYE